MMQNKILNKNKPGNKTPAQAATLQAAAITDNRRQMAVQREQVTGMNNKTPVLFPIQMKAGGALENKPVSAGNAVMQLSKWKWNGTTKKWELLKGAGDDKPFFDGSYDGEIIDDDEKEEKDDTYKGKRTFGDSTALAKNKYSLSSKKLHVDFKDWKKHREAQHIIPAAIAKEVKPLQGIIDSSDNAIMLPDTLKPGNTKVTHRKPKHRDHPKYTANVKKLINEVVAGTTLKKNQTTLTMIMAALRPVNKLATYSYLDDIPYAEFKNAWNTAQPGYPI